MKCKRSAVLVLFGELGFKTADKWNAERLQQKVTGLPGVLDDDTQPTTDESKKLLAKILEAIKDEDSIDITDDVAAAPAAETKAEAKTEAAPATKAKGKAKAKAEEPVAETKAETKAADATETKDADAPATKAKGKKPEKAGGQGSPGVIGTIVEVLTKATAEKPATKEDILNVLAARFPDRERDSMGRTINVQMPGRLRSDKGLNVVKSEKGGYYIAEGKPATA